MKKLMMKMSFWVIVISLCSGYSLNMSLADNILRTVFVYLIFSVLILLMYLVFNHSSYGVLKAQLEKETNRGRDSTRDKT